MHTQNTQYAQHNALFAQAQQQCTKPVDMYNKKTHNNAHMYTKLVAKFAKRFNYTSYFTVASVIVVFMHNNNVVAYYDIEQIYGYTV